MIDTKAIRAAAEAAIKKYGGYPVTDPAFVIALLDRLEAAEKDAARMGFLIDNDVYAAHLFSTTSGTFIREQIDAARKEQK